MTYTRLVSLIIGIPNIFRVCTFNGILFNYVDCLQSSLVLAGCVPLCFLYAHYFFFNTTTHYVRLFFLGHQLQAF